VQELRRGLDLKWQRQEEEVRMSVGVVSSSPKQTNPQGGPLRTSGRKIGRGGRSNVKIVPSPRIDSNLKIIPPRRSARNKKDLFPNNEGGKTVEDFDSELEEGEKVIVATVESGGQKGSATLTVVDEQQTEAENDELEELFTDAPEGNLK
jgi:hypothetical protein